MELLVVIVIIATLAGLILPALNRAREKGRAIVCANHLKQLTLAVLMYAQDNNDELPLSAMALPGGFANWHDIVGDYVNDTRTWLCPSSKLPPADGDGKPSTHFAYNAFYLNGMALDFSNWPDAVGANTGEIARPTETVLMTDSRATTSQPPTGIGKYLLPPSEPPADFWGRPEPRHNGGVNVAWCDGHIEWMRREQFYDGQSPPDRFLDLE